MLVDVRPGLHNHLATSSEIAALVSGRIYPIRMLDGNRSDCIVYHRILESENYHFIGPSGLIGSRFQIDSISQSASRVNQIANLVKERLGGFSGQWVYSAGSPLDLVNIQGVFLTTGFEDYDGESQMYRFSRDYMIWYEDQL